MGVAGALDEMAAAFLESDSLTTPEVKQWCEELAEAHAGAEEKEAEERGTARRVSSFL